MATKNTSARNQKAFLAGLPEDVSVDRIERHEHSVELFVSWKEPGIGERFCTRCGGNHCVKKDSGTVQTVRHLPVGLRGTLVSSALRVPSTSPASSAGSAGRPSA